VISELENTILVSSASEVGLDILFIMYDKSLMYYRKNSGPSIEPCGTSCLTVPIRAVFGVFIFYYYSLVPII